MDFTGRELAVLHELSKCKSMGQSSAGLSMDKYGLSNQEVTTILEDLVKRGFCSSRWQQTGTGGTQSLFFAVHPDIEVAVSAINEAVKLGISADNLAQVAKLTIISR